MSERWRSEPWMDLSAIIEGMGAHIDRLESALGVACQRLESWKAGALSAESALAHICGALGVAAPAAPPTCASCGQARDDIDEYTGVPGVPP